MFFRVFVYLFTFIIFIIKLHIVSIHSRARDVTATKQALADDAFLFQLTRVREMLRTDVTQNRPNSRFNPLACARCYSAPTTGTPSSTSFNSHVHARCNVGRVSEDIQVLHVSTHSRARDSTSPSTP